MAMAMFVPIVIVTPYRISILTFAGALQEGYKKPRWFYLAAGSLEAAYRDPLQDLQTCTDVICSSIGFGFVYRLSQFYSSNHFIGSLLRLPLLSPKCLRLNPKE